MRLVSWQPSALAGGARTQVAAALALVSMSGLAACSDSTVLFSDLPHVVRTVDQPKTIIERALSGCSSRVDAGETDCVKQELAAQKLSVAALAALVPGCHTGEICRYDYTTEDRVGFYAATASHYDVKWRVEFDLRKAPAKIEAVPVTVRQV